jgi:hypothetical protein
MTVENTTPNRGYQLPDGTNDLADDVLRLIAALSAIDVDVANQIVAIAGKAAFVHGHVIDDVTGLASALAAKMDADQRGVTNGVASLGGDGKVPAAQLPAALFGAMAYQGTWNANTNTPTIPAATSTNKGWYYTVATAGSTTIDGENDWKVGDWIISNGTGWDKIDNTDQVSSVAGLVGVITAAALRTELDLGGAALLNVGTGAGTVAAGNDSRITGAMPKSGGTFTGAVAGPTPSAAGHLATKGYIDGLVEITKGYVSAEQTIIQGGSLTLAHGLGGFPKIVQMYLVCKTAEFNFSVGDHLLVNAGMGASAGTTAALAVVASATTLFIRFVSTNPQFLAIDKTDGVVKSLTAANWRLVVGAYA